MPQKKSDRSKRRWCGAAGESLRSGAALAPRYAHASRRDKGQLLNEFCAVTGYTRKHAVVLLSCPPPEDRPPPYRARQPSYGPAELALLRMCWLATDGICSKRLAPFLTELLSGYGTGMRCGMYPTR